MVVMACRLPLGRASDLPPMAGSRRWRTRLAPVAQLLSSMAIRPRSSLSDTPKKWRPRSTSLRRRRIKQNRAQANRIVGLIGAALLYGDGVITPAISVLSAVEGLKIDAPSLAPMVVPITIAILVGLFLVQRKGTDFIGNISMRLSF
jgi:K+ potassium transporter